MVTWKIYKIQFEDGRCRKCIFADGHDVDELGKDIVKADLVGIASGSTTEEVAKITAELLLGMT